jgi:hypothetical protein
MQPDGTSQPTPETHHAGLIIAGVWLALGVFSCLGTGLAGATSESLGVRVSYVGVPLFVGGLGAMAVAPFVRSRGAATAIGAPLGCGCGGSLIALLLLVVFYLAIWPSL